MILLICLWLYNLHDFKDKHAVSKIIVKLHLYTKKGDLIIRIVLLYYLVMYSTFAVSKSIK